MGKRPRIFTQSKQGGIIHMLFRRYTKRELIVSGLKFIFFLGFIKNLTFFNNRRTWKLLGCESVSAELDVFSPKANRKSDHYSLQIKYQEPVTGPSSLLTG